MIRRNRKTSKQRGAALIESALSLPLFLACLFAIIQFGDMLRSVSWLSRTAFEAARAAGESQRSVASARAIGVAQHLFEAQEQAGENQRHMQSRQIDPPQFDDGNRMVSVTLQMQINPLIPYGPNSLRARVVAPMLTSGIVNDQGFGEFMDGPCVQSGSYYTATGSCVSSPPGNTTPVTPTFPPVKEGQVQGSIATDANHAVVSDTLVDIDIDSDHVTPGGGSLSGIGSMRP